MKPIQYQESKVSSPPAKPGAAAPAAGGKAGAPSNSGFTTRPLLILLAGMMIRFGKKYEDIRGKLDWENTTGSARKWWETFENEKYGSKSFGPAPSRRAF